MPPQPPRPRPLFHRRDAGRYATLKKLTPDLVSAARALIADCATDTNLADPPPLRISFDHVTLEGFGSFAARTDYPLRQRGLVLLRGAARAGRAAELPEGDGGMGVGAYLGELGERSATGGSNGAGKTTLAMAPLWALTGRTDLRASGSPVELRGVITEGAKAARVTLRGHVSTFVSIDRERGEGSGQRGRGEAGGGEAVPFEVTRTMSKRQHTLRLVVGETVHEGTLQQVQAKVNEHLRADSLWEVSFFGQHLAGGEPCPAPAWQRAHIT